MYVIRKIIGHKDNEPILEDILEHRGKNKGTTKIFKSVYDVNKYMKNKNISWDKHYIYVHHKQ